MSANTTCPSQTNGKTSVLRGLFSTKEPSARALQQYEKQVKKQQKSRGVKGNTVVGLPMTSSAKLPSSVPKVNSKWDGMPNTTSNSSSISKSWSNLAFSTRSGSSHSSAFSKDKDLQQSMKEDILSSQSSMKSTSDVVSEQTDLVEKITIPPSAGPDARSSYILRRENSKRTCGTSSDDATSTQDHSRISISDDWLENNDRGIDTHLQMVFTAMCSGHNKRRDDSMRCRSGSVKASFQARKEMKGTSQTSLENTMSEAKEK